MTTSRRKRRHTAPASKSQVIVASHIGKMFTDSMTAQKEARKALRRLVLDELLSLPEIQDEEGGENVLRKKPRQAFKRA